MDAADYDQEQQKCKDRLAELLDLEQVPDHVWGGVVSEGLVYDAVIQDDEDSWTALRNSAKQYAKNYREAAGYLPPPTREDRSVPRVIETELGGYVLERTETLTEVAAALAASAPEVQRFRSEVLGNELLTNEQAEHFYFGTGTEDRRFQQDWLNKLARWLVKHYRWREGDAAWFILTGYAALIRPLEVKAAVREGKDHLPNTARITLIVDPSVDAGVVEEAYRAVQRQVLGGDNRPLWKSTLDMARFVARRIRKHGAESGAQRHRAWNSEHPDKRRSNRGAVQQAFEKLAHPEYHDVEFSSYEPTPYQVARDSRRQRLAQTVRKRNDRIIRRTRG